MQAEGQLTLYIPRVQVVKKEKSERTTRRIYYLYIRYEK